MLFDTITIVGVGLIGGSIGRAAKAKRIARRVVGLGRNREFLQLAVELEAIDDFVTDFKAARDSDLVIVCTPVDEIAGIVRDAFGIMKTGCIITDVGSTKQNVSDSLRNTNANGVRYVGSHPLAGSEKSGVEHAVATLFEGKTSIVTTDDADEESIAKVESFWRHLGSRVLRMTAAEHDRAVAFTSHLPHAVASAVAGVLPPEWLPLAASGFKDTTRVAAGDVPMWDAIFDANREMVLAAADVFDHRFDQFRQLLAGGDRTGLRRWLDEGKQVRDALGS